MSNQHQANDNPTVGRWSREEHQLFLEGTFLYDKGLEIYGKNWKEISKLVGTRSGAQIRSHAQKYFEQKNKSDESFGCHSGEGEKNESFKSVVKNCSFSEEETGANFSYFFSGISKYLKENSKLCFWEGLIGGGEKNSISSEFNSVVSKRSFELCTKSIITKEIIILSKAE